MDKDARGIERGKCACGECEDLRAQMEQLVAIVAVCRLAILKRMPAPPLTLMIAHRLYNSDKLSSLRVDELSLYFSHHKITFKWKKAEEIAMIKAHIGSLLYDSMERQQPRQPPLRNVRQQVTSSLSEVETNLQSDVVDRIVGAGPSSSSDKSSPVTDFIPEPRAETSNYGRKRAWVEREVGEDSFLINKFFDTCK